MKTLFVLLCIFLPLAIVPAQANFKKASAFDIELSRKRCTPPTPEEAVYVRQSTWNHSSEYIKKLAKQVYHSPGRLANRAYYNPKTQRFHATFHDETLEISQRLIKSVTSHIETALAMGYADHIIFSDMGHAHILAPKKIYESIQPSLFKDTLAFFYAHPQTKFLYHTAEQLRMLNDDNKLINDRYLQQRFFTRNLVVDNTGSSEIHLAQSPIHEVYNTVRSWPNHRYMSGFDISANRNGCFPYYDKNNNLKYFDISPDGHVLISPSNDNTTPTIRGTQ